MINKEDTMAFEECIRLYGKVPLIPAIQDNDRSAEILEVKCKKCKKVYKFPILRDPPLSLQKCRCPICGRVECVCFMNLILN